MEIFVIYCRYLKPIFAQEERQKRLGRCCNIHDTSSRNTGAKNDTFFALSPVREWLELTGYQAKWQNCPAILMLMFELIALDDIAVYTTAQWFLEDSFVAASITLMIHSHDVFIQIIFFTWDHESHCVRRTLTVCICDTERQSSE